MSPWASQAHAYRRYDDDPLCRSAAFYLLELVSREGSRSQVIVCKSTCVRHGNWDSRCSSSDSRIELASGSDFTHAHSRSHQTHSHGCGAD